MDAPNRLDGKRNFLVEAAENQRKLSHTIERIDKITNPVLRQEIKSTIDEIRRVRPYLFGAFVKLSDSLEDQFYSLMMGIDRLIKISYMLKKEPEKMGNHAYSWIPQYLIVPSAPAASASQEEKLSWQCKRFPKMAEWLLTQDTINGGQLLRGVTSIDSNDLPTLLALIAQHDNNMARLGCLQRLVEIVPFNHFAQILEYVTPLELEQFIRGAVLNCTRSSKYDLLLPLFQALTLNSGWDATLEFAINLVVPNERYSADHVFLIITELLELVSDPEKKSALERKVKEKYKLLKIS